LEKEAVMKYLLVSIGGGIIGAAMVLAIHSVDFTFISPAKAQNAFLSQGFLKCFLKKMDGVHTAKSGLYLERFCKDFD